MAATIEQAGDEGFGVKRNGIILLRTTTETEWQAMGNGLVLCFGLAPGDIDWMHPESIVLVWQTYLERSDERFEIVRCRAVDA